LKHDYRIAFLKNNIFVSIGTFLVYAKGIILLPLLIKTVGVSTYGSFILLISYISVLYGISSFGIGFSYQRFMPSAKGEIRTDLFYFQFLFHLCSVGVLALVCILGNRMFKSIFLSPNDNYFALYTGLTLFSTLLYNKAVDYFRYTNRMNYFSVATSAYPYLNIVIIIVFMYTKQTIDLNFLLLANIVSLLLVALPLLSKVYFEIGFKLPSFAIQRIVNDIKIGFPLVLVFITDFVMAGSDRFIIAFYMTSQSVGFYNPAYTLGSFVIMFPKVLGVVLPPLLSKATDENETLMAQILLNKAVKLYVALIIPFIIGCLTLSRTLLVILANEEVANASYFITPIIAIGMFFYGMTIILAHGVAFVKMQTKVIFYANLIAGVSSVLLNFIFIYLLRNIIIAAIVSLISYVLSYFFLYYRTKTIMRIEFDKQFTMRILYAGISMGVFIEGLMPFIHSKFIVLGFIIPSSIIFYIVVVLLIRAFNKSEIEYFRSIIKLKFSR